MEKVQKKTDAVKFRKDYEFLQKESFMEKINIAIADDNERMQEMLGNVIKQDDTLELIGQTGNGNDIYSIIRDKEPDVVLLDIFMPKMDGLTVMEKVNEDKNLKKDLPLSLSPP